MGKLRQLWIAFENLSPLKGIFLLRQCLIFLVNRGPLTQCFVSFEATFVPVWGSETPLENRARVKAGLSFENGFI